MRSKNKTIIGLLLAMFFLRPTCRAWAEETLVLTVRPELLRKTTSAPQTSASVKDIFNWPVETPKPGSQEQRQIEELTRQALAALKLEAILWSQTRPQAIISGCLLGVGDELEGIKVSRIDKESVTLSKDNQSQTLAFDSMDITLDTETRPSARPGVGNRTP
ncbi:MAG: hypothetical protein A2521_05485 [Deltaproteobacteria bacterium RIFOXYD12_FULL_57_12]|nr:MAG: hypothetical protein A2521_05485 [Deltaproteobacteria bacterium RIFOXYD12_FULL_57_12]